MLGTRTGSDPAVPENGQCLFHPLISSGVCHSEGSALEAEGTRGRIQGAGGGGHCKDFGSQLFNLHICVSEYEND